MLGGFILDCVDSINDLGVVMDSTMSLTGHIDVTVGTALAMLRFVKRLSCELRDLILLRPFMFPYVWRLFCGVQHAWYSMHCVVCGGLICAILKEEEPD
jgi:hypothetical protein